MAAAFERAGWARAGEGNRTPITSLEGWGSTVELHPHGSRSGLASFAIGARGFEPPTPCSQSRCATRLRHAPPRPAVSITEGYGPLNHGGRGDGLYLFAQETPAQSGELRGVGAADVGGAPQVVGVARAAEVAATGEDATDLEGGLACGGDQSHLRPEDAVDGGGDQGVVSASQNNRVHPPLYEGFEVDAGHLLELGAVHDAALDEGDELRAGPLVDLDAGVEGVDRPPVRPALGGHLRGQHAHAAVDRVHRRRPRAGLYDAHYRDVE